MCLPLYITTIKDSIRRCSGLGRLLSPLLQCREAISRATRVCPGRPAGPFSVVLGDAGVERGARLLGRRACVAVDLGLLAL